MELIKIDSKDNFNGMFLKHLTIVIISGVVYTLAIASSYNYQDFEGDGKLKTITYFVVVLDNSRNQYFVTGTEFETHTAAFKFYKSILNATKSA